LYIEITTGMSAPPIGSVIRSPKPRARIKKSGRDAFTESGRDAGCKMTNAPETMARTRTAMLTICWPVKVIGRDGIQPCSFRNAMRLPENETAPIRPPTTASELVGVVGAEERDSRDPGCRAAPHPVEECNHLGMLVIATRLAGI